jgi:SAM-dependent methyltransferase
MAALSSNKSGIKPSSSEYWKSRDFHDSERYRSQPHLTLFALLTINRLHLQHWLFIRQLGWLLHPSIPQAKNGGAGLRIADLGCENAAWLIELAPHVPNAKLEGFDIASTHFPAKEWLPVNVSLHQTDILGELPDHLHGAFDIIQVPAFTTCIAKGETRPFLQAVRKMLKPGGYFQWVEGTTGRLRAVSPNESVSKRNSDRLCKWFRRRDLALGETFEWHMDIPRHLKREGFEVVQDEFSEIPKLLYKGWNDDLFSVFEQIGRALPDEVDARQKDDGAMTAGEYQELWNGVLEESQRGVAITFGELVIVVGRKS